MFGDIWGWTEAVSKVKWFCLGASVRGKQPAALEMNETAAHTEKIMSYSMDSKSYNYIYESKCQ